MINQVREYKIISKIGEGGMGIVYKAFDENLERFVAIKAIHSFYTNNEELLTRFKNEAKLQASLTHPNIVSLYNFFKENDTFFMVMEFIDGETLSQRIKRVGLIPPHKCIPLFIQILTAIDYAHKRGVIHRDIKPSNILVTWDDMIKVMDFGIAKVIGERGLTKTGTKMGTIYYMSPEQVQGIKDIDARSDIYSLGITFFEMLTGQLPYNVSTESDFIIMKQIVEVQIPSVKKYYPYVPDKVDIAIRKATSKNREERFQSCQEFIEFIQFEEIPEQWEVSKKAITVPNIEDKSYRTNQRDFDFNRPYIEISSETYEYPKAPPGLRIAAHILDALILGVPFALVISLIFTGIRSSDENYEVVGIIFIFLFIFIATIKDGLREGRGISKGFLNLRTINVKTNRPISVGRAAVRGLINTFGVLIYYIGFLIDIILIFADRKGRRIADFILNTQVIEEQYYDPSNGNENE